MMMNDFFFNCSFYYYGSYCFGIKQNDFDNDVNNNSANTIHEMSQIKAKTYFVLLNK